MSECLSTWDCSDCWQFTYSYQILKRLVIHHINIKVSCWSQISFSQKLSFTVRNVCALTLMTCPKLKQIKNENNGLPDHLFFYILWYIRSFIHPSLGHYLRLSSWCKWKQALIHPYSTILPFLYKTEMISIKCHK